MRMCTVNNKIMVLLITALLLGCSNSESTKTESATTPETTQPAQKDYAAEAARVSSIRDSAGFKLLSVDQDQLLSVDDPLVSMTNQKIQQIHELSGLPEMSIADMAFVGASEIRKENVSVSANDILDMLIATLPEQKADLAAPSIDKKRLIAGSVASYGSMRINGMSHKEATESFTALLKEMQSPEFAKRMNDYMNSQQ